MLHPDIAASQAGAIAVAVAILGVVFRPRTRGRLIAFLVVGILAAATGAILASLLYQGYADARLRWDLRQEGAAATGTILSVAPGKRDFACEFEFRCADGDAHRGKASARFKQLPAVGDAIDVRYLPADHRRAMAAEPVLGATEPAFERALALYGLWGLNLLIAGMLVALRLMAPKPRATSSP